MGNSGERPSSPYAGVEASKVKYAIIILKDASNTATNDPQRRKTFVLFGKPFPLSILFIVYGGSGGNDPYLWKQYGKG